MAITTPPPPRYIEKFNTVWKDWLYYLWEIVSQHSGGVLPTPPATATSWNAHGNTAIGDGTATNPLKIEDSTFWIEGLTGLPPADAQSVSGTRFMWIPTISGLANSWALRVGNLSPGNNTLWDTANLGGQSVCIGSNTKASGNGSIAMVSGAISTGASSIAIGNIAQSGPGSGNVAIGTGAKALGSLTALSLGGETEVSSGVFFGTAVGYQAKASLSLAGFKSFGLAAGFFVEVENAGGIVIGSGAGLVSKAFKNPKADSMMLGANIDSSAGEKATLTLFDKKCGIGNHDPLSTLDINGSVGFKYTNITGIGGNTYTVGTTEEYTFRIDISNLTGTQSQIMQLPAMGASAVDRRIYYFKITDINGTASAPAHVTITPDAGDQIEDFITGDGTPLAAGVPLNIFPGTAITLIANNDDGIWWVI